MSLPRNLVVAFRLALIAALAVITHLATTRLNYPVVQELNDKLSHIFAFYVLALLTEFSFPKRRFGSSQVLVLMGYGLLIEIVQYFLPYRTFSLYDWAADGIGLAIYWFSRPALRHVPMLRRRWPLEAEDDGR
jgi:VanZ family protein